MPMLQSAGNSTSEAVLRLLPVSAWQEWQEGRDRVLGQIGRIGLTGGIYDYGLVRLEGGQKGDT